MRLADLRRKVADPRQFASVRRIVLDDGPERGVRALAFSTGGGLDFWVLSDRSLDIGPLTWRGAPVAWQSPTGFRSPALTDVEADGGRGFLRSFSGLLVTCGLDHIRQPQPGHPLHGRLPYTPARVLAYGEDWDRDEPCLFCEGEIDQVRHLGEALRLRRRIEAPVGGGKITIRDRVTNLGAMPHDHQILYHINFGWPALDTGSILALNGETLVSSYPPETPDGGETTACYPAGPDAEASCSLSMPGLRGSLELTFDTATLPVLQLWQDPRPQVRVLGLEPCTSERGPGGTSGPPVVLQPGECRDYRLTLAFSAG